MYRIISNLQDKVSHIDRRVWIFLIILVLFTSLLRPTLTNAVDPLYVEGNPSCRDLGYRYGFKIDGSPNGTFIFIDSEGELIGGAIGDPANSVTISNSDGTYFDWSSTLSIDAVIVKGGPNSNEYAYSPESYGDTGLHAPMNPKTDDPYGLSHIEFCYDYEITVEKSAETSFARTFDWDIEKSVYPDTWSLFTGDSGTSDYTVILEKTGYEDSDWMVSGEVQITNPDPGGSDMIYGVLDEMTGGLIVDIDCGVDFPYEIEPGETLTCTYERSLPDGMARVNTVWVDLDDESQDIPTATADVVFGGPTTLVNDEVNVEDSVVGGLGVYSNNATITYDRTFTCDEDEGEHQNVATIVETQQSDDAWVDVNCYGLDVTKDASTYLIRTWDWMIDKSADQTELELEVGDLLPVNYTVELTASSTDSDHRVQGAITIANENPDRDAYLTEVSDIISPDIVAMVECEEDVVPAGGEIVCGYAAELPDDAERLNTATATLQNYDYDSEGTAVEAGTTDYSGNVMFDFDEATVSEIDEMVTVSDTNYGELGTVYASEAPKTFQYTLYFGDSEEADVVLECGENSHDNVASFLTNDTGAYGEDTWTVIADLICEYGCTYTPGYWKTHSSYGPAPYDPTWAMLGEDAVFFLSGQGYYEALMTESKGGNAYYILARAYIAAELNMLWGASVPDEVEEAFEGAEALLEWYTPADVAMMKGKSGGATRNLFIHYADILDQYNNGILGPGHCE